MESRVWSEVNGKGTARGPGHTLLFPQIDSRWRDHTVKRVRSEANGKGTARGPGRTLLDCSLSTKCHSKPV
jgi:hypothetical protein